METELEGQETIGSDGVIIESSKSCLNWSINMLLSFCFASVLNPGKKDVGYYQLLGLQRDATSQEIDEAFKFLLRSYHPDDQYTPSDLTEQAQIIFLNIKIAYDVLIDPYRRRIYDTIGFNGLLMIEDPEMFFSNQENLRNILSRSIRRIVFIFLLLTCFIVVFVLFTPILFALKVDSTIKISWSLVFVPIWVTYMGILLIIQCYPFSNEIIQDLEVFSLFVTAQVLVAMKLDGEIGGSWFVILIPYFLFEIVQLILLLDNLSREHAIEHQVQLSNDDKDQLGRKEADVIIMQIMFISIRLCQCLLIILKVVGCRNIHQLSWWFILSPTFLWVLILLCAASYYEFLLRTERTIFRKIIKQDMQKVSKAHLFQELVVMMQNWWKKVQQIIFFELRILRLGGALICWLVHVIVFGFYLESRGSWSFFWMYLPCLVLTMCSCTGICCFALGCLEKVQRFWFWRRVEKSTEISRTDSAFPLNTHQRTSSKTPTSESPTSLHTTTYDDLMVHYRDQFLFMNERYKYYVEKAIKLFQERLREIPVSG